MKFLLLIQKGASLLSFTFLVAPIVKRHDDIMTTLLFKGFVIDDHCYYLESSSQVALQTYSENCNVKKHVIDTD